MPDNAIPREGDPGGKLVVKGSGVVEYGRDGRPCKVWTRYGDTAPNPWLNHPLPRVTYKVGESVAQRDNGVRLCHTFVTAYDGSTDRAEVVNLARFSGVDKGVRWSKEQATPVGFPSGNFDRGHLIAAEFGAGMEAINLVSMPKPVNRAFRPETARKGGFERIADLGDEYLNDSSFLMGTLTYRGEVILPNYRRAELFVRRLVNTVQQYGGQVSMRVRPATVHGVTDVLHLEVWLNDHRFWFEVDNDIDRGL